MVGAFNRATCQPSALKILAAANIAGNNSRISERRLPGIKTNRGC